MRLKKNYSRLILILISFGIVILTVQLLTQKFIFSGQTETIALANAIQKSQERENVFLNFFTDSQNTIRSVKESDSFNEFLNGTESSKLLFEQLVLTITVTFSKMQEHL